MAVNKKGIANRDVHQKFDNEKNKIDLRASFIKVKKNKIKGILDFNQG